jgi:hypothetical protein
MWLLMRILTDRLRDTDRKRLEVGVYTPPPSRARISTTSGFDACHPGATPAAVNSRELPLPMSARMTVGIRSGVDPITVTPLA